MSGPIHVTAIFKVKPGKGARVSKSRAEPANAVYRIYLVPSLTLTFLNTTRQPGG